MTENPVPAVAVATTGARERGLHGGRGRRRRRRRGAEGGDGRRRLLLLLNQVLGAWKFKKAC